MVFGKQIRITPGAMQALKAAGTFGTEFVLQHHQSDWGEVSEEDRRQNERGMAGEAVVLLSIFTLPRTGQKLWVLTPPDRRCTHLLLPEEY